MLKLVKKFKYLIIISFSFCISFVLLAVIPTSYDLTVPATIDNIDNIYNFSYIDDTSNIKEIDTSDVNVNSVAVYSYYNVSILSYLQAKLNPFATLEEHNQYVNTSVEYSQTSGTIQKNVSLTNSLIIAYRLAGKQINALFKGNIVHSIFGLGDSKFKLGDIIIECQGMKVTEDKTVTDILLETEGKIQGDDGYYYLNIQLNKDYHFKVLRNEQEVEITIQAFPYYKGDKMTPSLGINYYSYYLLYKEGTNPLFEIVSPDTYGPSAGLMQALFIYDALSGEKLTKNLKIVGTGTVDVYGNAGSIGGVKAKVVAAHLAKADIFFVPSANYEEAYERYLELNSKMKLISVNSLQDVIRYLRTYQKGGNWDD